MLQERERLSGEIHDTLAQGFTSIVMHHEAAEAALSEIPDPARRHLDQAKRTARDSLAEARRLVWALRPEALDRASLIWSCLPISLLLVPLATSFKTSTSRALSSSCSGSRIRLMDLLDSLAHA